jgi:cytochrome P450
MTAERTLFARLADADSRKIARWLADRIREIGWHVKRLQMVARDATGLPRKLPPGSLAARCLHEAVTDDRYYMKQFRHYGPIFKLFWGSGNLKICIEGFERGRRLLNEHRDALRLGYRESIKQLVPVEFRFMNPEIHPHYRRIFLSAFRDDLVAPSESGLRELMRRGLAHMAQRAGEEPGPAIPLYETLNAIASRSLLRTLLGVDPESETGASLEAMYRRLGPRGVVEEAGAEQAVPFQEIHDVVAQLRHTIELDPLSPAGDSVLRRLVEKAPSEIDETLVGNLIYMVERGRHDLRDLLRWIVKYLSDYPAPVAAMRADLAGPAGTLRLAEPFVLETLRLDQAEVLHRRAVQSFEFEGFRFPKECGVAILIRESHQNPVAFADPDAFRPERFLDRRPSRDDYAPFGIDEHQCIAGALVVRLCTLFVEELVRGYTWTVTGDGPRRYNSHGHWEPSRDFAIALAPSAPGVAVAGLPGGSS